MAAREHEAGEDEAHFGGEAEMNDQAAGYLCIMLGGAVGAYTAYALRKGRINFRGVSTRAHEPIGFWISIVCATVWSAGTLAAGVYMILGLRPGL